MTPPATEVKTAAPRGIFYGWWIVAVSTLAMMLSNGFSVGGLPAFYKEMLTDLGAKGAAPEIGRAIAITFILSGLLSPLAGFLITKMELRAYMTIGCALLGSGLFLYARAESAMHIYLAHVLFGLTLCFISVIPNTMLVSNWFRRLRGIAMGIVVTGTSLGTVFIPMIATPLIKSYGWRTALLLMSSSVWVVLLPAIWLIVKVHPRSLQQGPDGDVEIEVKAVENPSAVILPGLTLSEALRTPLFWIFSVCAMMLFYAILAVVQQLVLYLTSPQIGMSNDAARSIQSWMGLSSIGGKFIFGFLSDRLPRPLVNVMCCAVLCIGSVMLLGLSADKAFAFALVFGLGYGGAFVTIQLLIAECFGLRDLGRIISVIALVETGGGALGNLLTERIAKQGGGYAVGYYGVVAASVVALLAAIILSRLMAKKTTTL